MEKIMYYGVDQDGSKWLMSYKPLQSLDDDNGAMWCCNHDCEECTGGCIMVQDDEVASLGLPDMTFKDLPLEVRLVCVNKQQ